MLPPNGKILLIDSGAYSAWNSNKKVSLEEYTEWCLSVLDKVDYFVNLDVIPGRRGVFPSQAEVEESAFQGMRNYYSMVRAGIPKEKLIHVFHQGESMKWLKRMVDMPYIGLSPANDRNTRDKDLWLERCMEIVTDEEGIPKNKWHGFGVVSPRIMKKYPWFSIDSAKWSMTASWGAIILLHPDKNSAKTIPICRRKAWWGVAYQEEIEERMDKWGFTWEELTGASPVYRMKWNILEYNEFVEKYIPKWPWAYRQRGVLF